MYITRVLQNRAPTDDPSREMQKSVSIAIEIFIIAPRIPPKVKYKKTFLHLKPFSSLVEVQTFVLSIQKCIHLDGVHISLSPIHLRNGF